MKRYLIILFSMLSLAATAQDCLPVKLSDFPLKDLPPKTFKPQDAKAAIFYYYGIGVPVNYDSARYYAFSEFISAPVDHKTFEGPDILMMLYANGFGVQKDLDLCIRLVCNVGGATAEIEGRKEHLEGMRKVADNDTFDICDDITSGYMMSMCTFIITSINDHERLKETKKLLSAWPAKDTIAYKAVRKAADDFFENRSRLEIDLTGTARGMFYQEEMNSLGHDFLEKLAKADKCGFQSYTMADFTAADKELNVVYKILMNNNNIPKDDATVEIYGVITKDGIKTTQRSWLPYRDAWVDFVHTRCPQLPVEAIKTILTVERTGQLKELIEQY